MGQEIASEDFTAADFEAFRHHLRGETTTLKSWFDQRAFDHSPELSVGLELEAWLVDENALPAPVNRAFLAAADDPDIVEELSAFNVEINAPPASLGGAVFSQTRDALERVWSKCRTTGAQMGVRPVMTGILPTVRDEMLQLDWMSDTHRYRALNRQLMALRQREPLHIDISGTDHLEYAVTTSCWKPAAPRCRPT